MTDLYTYQRKRRDLGKPCNFQDTPIELCGYIPQNQYIQDYQYTTRNPNFIDLDNVTELSEHQVNTEKVKTKDKGMCHKEGGWPHNVDPNDPNESNKHKKKIEKSDLYPAAITQLCQSVSTCMRKNNQIDLFEEYFYQEISEHVVENLSSKTLMLFKDKNEKCKRSVSEISWHPEGPTKIACSYAIMRFQSMPEMMPTQAYIWDLENPNDPQMSLQSPSPVTSIQYNGKLLDMVGGGCYNGLIAIWDVRTKGKPVHESSVETSHFDPITHFQWVHSRAGTECVSTSTDGMMMYWDYRKFDAPLNTLQIQEGEKDPTVGGTVLEYNIDAGPSKLLIGTESGSILTASKKPNKPYEISNSKYGVESGRHLGPVYSINRSPIPKYFMSVGDWSCKVWVEDLKTPIIRTKYHGAYLSDGCWSPTRNGAFFLIRRDGWMDVWDYYYRQNEIAFSHKVSDAPLSCIKINNVAGGSHNSGKLVAIGDQEGTVTLLELCESLYSSQPKEKDIITEMFEREFRKEKNLVALQQKQEKGKGGAKDESKQREKHEKRKQELLQKADDVFNNMISEYEQMKLDEEADELDSPSIKKGGNERASSHQGSEEQQGEEQKQQQQEEEVESQLKPDVGTTSMLAEFLTEDVWNQLKDVKDSHGYTLKQLINSGAQNHDSGIGVYAGSPDSYTAFAPLLDKIIEKYHGHKAADNHQSDWDITKLEDLENLDPDNEFCVSTRIRVARNLAEHMLGTGISKDNRRVVEKSCVEAFNTLPEGLQGKYYSLSSLSEDEKKQLIEDHFLFKQGDKYLEACGLNRDWPNSRGIFHNEGKTFLVWVNEEDQLRIISMQKGGDIKEVFERLATAQNHIEQQSKFAYNDHLGYITTCPTNLGTGLRASIMVKLPLLSKNNERFQKIADDNNVQIRGSKGEHSESDDGTYDISNKRRLGYSEVSLVRDMYNGVKAMIEAEKELQQQQ